MTEHSIEELQIKMIEEGRLPPEDAYTLTLVTNGKIPYDEYQELISDRRDYKSRVCRFGFQAIISGSVSAFAMGMLISGHDAGVYLPILTGIIGYWLPSPDFSKQNLKKLK